MHSNLFVTSYWVCFIQFILCLTWKLEVLKDTEVSVAKTVTKKKKKSSSQLSDSLRCFLPGADIQLAAVDDTRKLKQDGKPATNPNPITRGNIHVITGVFPQGLDRDAGEDKFKKFNITELY